MDNELQSAFRALASISAWGCVWFNTTEPSCEENWYTDMYRVEIHETDCGGERLVNQSGNDLVETITRALAVYDAKRIKPSMEVALGEAIREHYGQE